MTQPLKAQFPMATLFLCALLLLSAGLVSAQDSFEAEQRAAQAQNSAGITCTLLLPEGRTQFQQGELILVTLSFTSDRPGAYQMSRWSFKPLEAFHVSPSEGVADPMADEPKPTFFSYEGPPPPEPLSITDKPVTVSLMLNASLRFDKPGAYQLYVTSSRVLDGTVKPSNLFNTGKALPAVSNIVSFTIVSADPAWAHTQAARALAEIQNHYRGPITVPYPDDVLTCLGTPEAARAMLSVIASDTAPRSSETAGRWCRNGLIGYPDRTWLVGEMERDLTAPNYPITQAFLETLTTLAARQQKAGNTRPDSRTVWMQAADAVPAKSPQAVPVTLHTLLETAWLTSLGNDKAVQARLPELKRRMALVFDRLPPLPQDYLLGDEWSRFRSPTLLPALRRMWAIAVRPENGDTALNDLILRRLYDLSPKEGHTLILKEAAAAHPRVTIATLGILPDKTLPTLDRTLAQRLAGSRNSDMDVTCQLIARYGTPAIFPAAYTFFQHETYFTSAIYLALLSYCLRVRPDDGAAMIHKELAHALGRGRMETLLTDLALERYDPRLERITVAALNNLDPGIVADAARTLEQHGSPQTEAALWARLHRQDANAKNRAIVEEALVGALTAGQNWYESPARLAKIRALCVTPSGQRLADETRERTETGKVHLNYQISDAGWWDIGRYGGRGRSDFLAKLAQFPRGTVFSWQDLNVGPEEERLFAQTQRFVLAHGMTVKRWQPPTGWPIP